MVVALGGSCVGSDSGSRVDPGACGSSASLVGLWVDSTASEDICSEGQNMNDLPEDALDIVIGFAAPRGRRALCITCKDHHKCVQQHRESLCISMWKSFYERIRAIAPRVDRAVELHVGGPGMGVWKYVGDVGGCAVDGKLHGVTIMVPVRAYRNDLIQQLSCCLCCCCALLALQGVFVLGSAAYVVTACNHFCRIQHRHVDVLMQCHQSIQK